MADRPRIGYVLKRFPRFSETFILNELLALEEQGFAPHVWSLLSPPDEPRHARLADLRAGVTLLGGTEGTGRQPDATDVQLFAGQTDSSVARLIAKADRIAAEAAAMGITHLHAHFASDATTTALLAARRMGGTFSFTAHARDIWRDYVDPATDAAKRRAKLAAAAFTVTVSDVNAAHLRTISPESADRIHRLYNGVDLDLFRPAPPERRHPRLIVAVGRLVEKKGFADLIDACALLRDKGVPLRCRIIGDGPLHDDLAARIAALRLSDRVELAGPMPQERLVTALAEASLVTLPCIVTPDGDRDGLPTVLLEAMARALPVVTTTVNGGPEIVADGHTGLVVPPNDPAALSRALGRLLSDPHLAHRMGKAGRLRAESLFDLRCNAGTLGRMFLRTAAPLQTARVA